MRYQLEALLAEYIDPTWEIVPYTDQPDRLDRPLVMIRLSQIAPGPTVTGVTGTANVFVLFPSLDDTGRNADALDDAMPFVVNVLHRARAVETVSATRGMFLDQWPAWDIELTYYATITEE